MSTAPEPGPAGRHLHAVDTEPTWSEKGLCDVSAEQAVLGMMMTSTRSVDEVADLIASRDFYQPIHATLFTALIGLWAANEPTDPIAAGRALDEINELQRVGGFPYLHTLTERVPTTSGTAAYYARIIVDWAKRRRTREAGLRIVQTSQDLSTPVDEVVDRAQAEIHAATVNQSTGSLLHVAVNADDEIHHLEKMMNGEIRRGLSTGLGALDEVLGGFLPGQLVVPAGRPGMGKTTAGLGFALASARRGRPALVFSLEMSRRELMWRLLSAVGGIELTSFTSGRMPKHDFEQAKKAAKTLASWPLHIDDQSNTVADIRSATRRFRQRHSDLGIVLVDYLQRMRSTQKFDRRDLEVGRNASELKTLGQEMETTMIVPAQLNRGPEGRTDRRPQLSDLRDSGEIEQEADVVILLHREDYYDKEHIRAGEADFIVAKQRNGPTDTVSVAAQLHLSRFSDFGPDDIPVES